MDLSLKTIRYFVAVAEARHFGRAAVELFISQPALSQQIKRFETQMGCQLLERSQTGVSLTHAGEVFLGEARILLERGSAAVALTRRAANHDNLVIACVAGTPHRVKDRLLEAADQFLPGIAITLLRIDWSEPFAHLRSGLADVVIAHLPCQEPGIECQVVHREPRVAVLYVGHRLAERTEVSINDISSESILDSDFNRDYWLVRPRPDGTEPVVVKPAANSAEQLMDFVELQHAIAITAQTVASLYKRPETVSVPIADIPDVELALVWSTAHPQPALASLAQAVGIG
jgi:DNA-binding transcriptional LysR family regulator